MLPEDYSSHVLYSVSLFTGHIMPTKVLQLSQEFVEYSGRFGVIDHDVISDLPCCFKQIRNMT